MLPVLLSKGVPDSIRGGGTGLTGTVNITEITESKVSGEYNLAFYGETKTDYGGAHYQTDSMSGEPVAIIKGKFECPIYDEQTIANVQKLQ